MENNRVGKNRLSSKLNNIQGWFNDELIETGFIKYYIDEEELARVI